MIKIKLLIVYLLVVQYDSLLGQYAVNIPNLKEIRLNKLKETYTGKPIRFLENNSISVTGVLRDVTKNDIIILDGDVTKSYNHDNISTIYVDPKRSELAIVFALGAVGAIGGYAMVLIGHPNPDTNMKGVIPSLCGAAATIWGYRSFYKTIQVDISGQVLGSK